MYEALADSFFLEVFDKMNKTKDKLIVWDFDGVIADTEKLWLQNRMIVLNEKLGLGWSIDTVIKNLAGISDKTKKSVLEKMGIITDDKFWDDLLQMDLQTMKKGFALTDGIADIFAMREFEQCIATGGIASKTALKIEMVKIEQYFPPQKVFTADMVKHGKPEPDLFLLAAKSMGFEPANCIVVEDSLAGLTAAIKAKMTPIAFVGNDFGLGEKYVRQIEQLGVKYICKTMAEVKEAILELNK